MCASAVRETRGAVEVPVKFKGGIVSIKGPNAGNSARSTPFGITSSESVLPKENGD